MPEKANSQLIRTINERRLLNLIRQEGPISRNKLAQRTNISKVAVSDIIKRLDKNGFILEIGKGKSTSKGGRRPTLIKLNQDNGYVIGIQIKRGKINIALANIEAKIKGVEQLIYKIDASIDEIISNIFDKIDLVLQKNNISEEKLVSIGIGMPGIIDYKKGVLRYAVTLRKWVNLPLASRFSSRYNVPTIIENDVNTITLSESLVGAGRGHSNLVSILIESGIGAGIILNGQLVRGETSHFGEIGFFEIGDYISNIYKLKNLYDHQRFFGEILSEVNLFNALKKKLRSDSSVTKEELERLTLKDMLVLGDNGNQFIQEIIDEYTYPLAIACINLIKSMDPGILIISGLVIEKSNYLYKNVLQLIEKSMINVPFEPSKITIGELKERAGVTGAIVMALQTIFEHPVTKMQNIENQFYDIKVDYN